MLLHKMVLSCVLTFRFHAIHMLVVYDTIVEDDPAFLVRLFQAQQQCRCGLRFLCAICFLQSLSFCAFSIINSLSLCHFAK